MDYKSQRLDPRWQKRRLEIMQRDGFSCSCCQSNKETLNVHHLYYIPQLDIWNYPDWSLVTLCELCHENRHSENDSPKKWDRFEKVAEIFLGNETVGPRVCRAILAYSAKANMPVSYVLQKLLDTSFLAIIEDDKGGS